MFDNLPTNNKQGQGDDSLGQTNLGKDKSTTSSNFVAPKQGTQSFGSPLDQQNKPTGGVTPQTTIPRSSTKQAKASASIPGSKPIEDMFSGSDGQEKPAIFQPKTSPTSINQAENIASAQIDPYTGEQIKAKNKTIVFALMLISLMLVAMLGWYAYRVFFANIMQSEIDSSAGKPLQDTASQVSPQQNKPVTLPTNNFNKQSTEQVKDTDGDGLSDQEERELNTNIFKADTDGDGLFDREEVKKYKTDPNNADTDGDGYADGLEVKGGYNPNGPGALYDTKTIK